MYKLFAALLGATLLFAAPIAQAAPVNDTGSVTSNILYGDGVMNRNFTGVTVGNLELALRGSLRYSENGRPADIQNYDGDMTYRFDRTGKIIPANRAVFSFDFSINTDVSDTDDMPDMTISDYIFELTVDTNPSASAGGFTFSPIVLDNAYGFNSTPPEGGSDGAGFVATRNVGQNSQNNGFYALPGSGALGDGIFTYTLSAFATLDGETRGDRVASTSIDVIVGQVAPVPLPAALPLMLIGLGGFAALRRSKRA